MLHVEKKHLACRGGGAEVCPNNTHIAVRYKPSQYNRFENAGRNVLISIFKLFKRKIKHRRIDYDTLISLNYIS